MPSDYGPGVSRVLDPSQAGFQIVVHQQGKPPLDSEINLIQQLDEDWRRILVLRGTPSGWLGNALNEDQAFLTSPLWSNWVRFGNQRTGEKRAFPWAVVNGWLIPVTGTLTGSPPGSPNDTDTWNRITLPPPPSNSGDTRIDFVFLEAWLARVPPNPAVTNKPSSSALWRYGNVEGGYTFLTDDIQDPAIGFETTQRIQLQYRLRVVQGLVGLSSYPDGFDPTVVKGQGAAATVTSYVFSNMRQELGDPGLWRAGDGSSNALGTVDGYTYAIPLAAVFRRNSVAWDGDPSQNLNGAYNRNPTAVDRTGYKTFGAVALNGNITASAMSLTLSTVTNIPLPLTPASAVTIQIGDEVMTYSVITGTTMTLTQRGAFGSKAEPHRTGDAITVLSGRPDGLFSDQIAKTDILDLRHAVNPNGFDYEGLLKGNLDKLLRGRLRSTWKRSGGGPQGAFVSYQDKISASPAALGVTKLDAPDNIRQVFSDAAVIQSVEFVASPPAASGGSISTNNSYDLDGTATTTTPGSFDPGSVLTIPIAQFKTGFPGSDIDQVRFLTENILSGSVVVQVDGQATPLTPNVAGGFTVATPTDPTDALEITLGGAFVSTTHRLYITLHLEYGPGRGISRRPDSLHSVAFLSSSPEILTQQVGVPADNVPLRAAWAPLWSKYRNAAYDNKLPVTAEAFIDPGSKTVILTPFRRIDLAPTLYSIDGAGLHAITPTNTTGGLMPPDTPGGAAKWGATDPLGLFSGYSDPNAARRNFYITLPRRLVPGWGEVQVPILHTDASVFDEGINFGVLTTKGAAPTADQTNYVPALGTSATLCTTWDFVGGTTATYNTLVTKPGYSFAGMRFFTDTRNLGREGLELPPFYGIARLYAVYEAMDFDVNGSAYNPLTREVTGGGATNLLRQNFDGSTFWIESDTDGDSTFILNAEAIDIAKSPNPIVSFASGRYVIEASLFGFDRSSFNLTGSFRLVLARGRTEGLAGAAEITAPKLVLPGQATATDEIVINYSRTPYQGDAWGSQGSQTDIPHKQGPPTTATIYEITSTDLNEMGLTRPNQKVLEVLASVGFVTTLGSGRLSGDAVAADCFDFQNVGYEDYSAFPPATAVDPRPDIDMGALLSGEQTVIGTHYHNCVERLPLGALFREKDFRGNYVYGANSNAGIVSGQLVYVEDRTPGILANGVAVSSDYEQSEVLISNASQASGQPGELVVHVDGSQGNYSLLTNYRTNRGGSAFTASGPYPGGEVSSIFANTASSTSYAGILTGIAMLVRNFVTNIGAQEASAGSELMLLIVTTAVRADVVNPTRLNVLCGTNGAGEGYSAADLYRLQGHPILRDNVRINVDPSLIDLSKRGA